MIRQNTKFPLLLDPPAKPDHQTIYCPTANFGPISRGSVINPILIILFDTGSMGLSQDSSSSECSALTRFSMSLASNYINLKEPFNQDIKE